MKHFLASAAMAALLCLTQTANAQITDDFENNNFGWTERAASDNVAIIKDGHLHLEGRANIAISSCYAPFDYSKPFEMTCEAYIKSLTGSKCFGIIMDYEDDMNYVLFTIEGECVYVTRLVNDKIVGTKLQDLKLNSKKRTGITFRIEYNMQKITLYVNDMRAIEYQRRLMPGQYMLGTSGIGFYAGKNTVVDFDNLEIKQQ